MNQNITFVLSYKNSVVISGIVHQYDNDNNNNNKLEGFNLYGSKKNKI
jgi:hypothetical protein